MSAFYSLFSSVSKSIVNNDNRYISCTSIVEQPKSHIILSNQSNNHSSSSIQSNNEKTIKKTENPFAKFLISGGVTIFFEACAGGHYLEMVKILRQTSNDPYIVITRRMTANKGIVGILDGFVPWGALQATVKGSSFGFGQALSLKFLEKFVPNDYKFVNDSTKMIISGGLGGFTQGIIMSPMLLLKTRVMTDARFRTTGGFWNTSIHSLKLGKELIKTEGGLKSLTKGMGLFSFKRFGDWTTRYGFVVLVENIVKKQTGKEKLDKKLQAICALSGGTLSALVTLPIDVLVATVQQAAKKGEKVNIIQVYKQQLSSGGMKGTLQLATRGLVARVSHVAITVLMMKSVSSWCYTFISNKINM